MANRIPGLAGLALLAGLAPGIAHAEFQAPTCNALVNWAAAGNVADKLSSGANYRVFQGGARLFSGLMDRNFVPVFGVPFDQVTDAQLTALSALSGDCRLKLRAAWQKQRTAAMQNLVSHSESYLYAVFFAGSKQTAQLLKVMALQRKAYVAYGQAVEVKAAQEAELATLKPSLESIERVRAMQGEKLLAFLGSDADLHRQNLDRHLKGMVDGIIVRNATAMREAPATLEGLRKIVALNVDTRKDLGKMRSSSWTVFNTAYADSINKAAAGAIDGFKAELAALPPTDEGMATVRKSPVTLFPYKPVPANYAAYQAAARDRLAAMGVERKAAACADTLAKRNLTDIAGIKLLGARGEST
ncbi:MAG: hypothetical protein KDE22_15235, partial [Rhodobacterales bacterium]|nr:hypothetical protein [Rhodobacterales bacterium]